MAKQPGQVFYYKEWNTIMENCDDETLGTLTRAALTYGQQGEEPEIAGTLRMVWGLVKLCIDRDKERYRSTVERSRYSGYCSAEKRAGREPLPFEEWRKLQGAASCEEEADVDRRTDGEEEQDPTTVNERQRPSTNADENQPTQTQTQTPTEAQTQTQTQTKTPTPTKTQILSSAREEIQTAVPSPRTAAAACPEQAAEGPPSLEEIEEYCRRESLNVDAERFLEYYRAGDWRDSSGRPVLNWRQKLRSWHNREQPAPSRASARTQDPAQSPGSTQTEEQERLDGERRKANVEQMLRFLGRLREEDPPAEEG